MSGHTGCINNQEEENEEQEDEEEYEEEEEVELAENEVAKENVMDTGDAGEEEEEEEEGDWEWEYYNSGEETGNEGGEGGVGCGVGGSADCTREAMDEDLEDLSEENDKTEAIVAAQRKQEEDAR